MQKVNCNCCGVEILRSGSEIRKSKTKKFYCSRSCSAKVNNLDLARNKPKERTCKKCGCKFLNSKEYSGKKVLAWICKECSEYHRNRTQRAKDRTVEEAIELLSVKGKHPSWKNCLVRTNNRAWNKHLTELPCQNCGYDKHVELCHIKPVSDFPLTATLGEINAESNNLVLCRNCHWEFDHELLRLEEISNHLPDQD